VIGVSPDIDKLLPLVEDKEKYALLLQGIQLPKKEIQLQVKKTIVYIESIEKKLGEPSQSDVMAKRIKQVLSAEGFAFGNDKTSADLLVEVAADTEKGKASGSIYITYFNLKINVINVSTGTEVHHAGIDRLKAYSLNYERSSQSGYDKGLEILEKETMPELIDQILR
jgi:hypothetical protein